MKKNIPLRLVPGMKVADLVTVNPNTLLLLEHFNIRPAFQEKTLEQVSAEYRINPYLLLSFAGLFLGNNFSQQENIGISDIPAILDYLRTSHSYYLDEKLPAVHQLLKKMTELNNHTEMGLAEKFFLEYEQEVIKHLDYENNTVFPYIDHLYNILNGNSEKDDLPAFSVSVYEEHHDDIEIKLSDLNNLLTKYLPVANDQQVRRNLIVNLFELGNDLRIHTMIEDHILIPFAEQLELKLGEVK